MGCDNSKPEKPKEPTKKIAICDETKKLLEAKIVLLGEQAVGKSSVAQRYCKKTFSIQHNSTIGGAYLQQRVLLNDGQSIKLHIWDTGGQERFRTMASLYYRDAAAAILIYDITLKESLENLKYWINELHEKCDKKNIVICLAGNKCDDVNNRKLQFIEGQQFANENNITIFKETSAKNDIGINELFNQLAIKLAEQINSAKNDKS